MSLISSCSSKGIFNNRRVNFSIRGRLESITSVLRSVGVIVAFILGPTVAYEYIPCIFVVIPILFLITFAMLPNTPQFYIQRGEIQVRKSIKYYQCLSDSSFNLIRKQSMHLNITKGTVMIINMEMTRFTKNWDD